MKYNFSKYYFIEYNEKRYKELKECILAQYPNKIDKVELVNGDCNEELPKIFSVLIKLYAQRKKVINFPNRNGGFMGLFDNLKKGSNNFDKQIAEMQETNASLSANAGTDAQKTAQNAASAMNSFAATAAVQKRGIRVFKVGEGDNAMCSCGCGQKAEYMFEIGDIKIPIANSCGNELSIKHLDVGKRIDEDVIETRVGRFEGTTMVKGNKISFKMNFGLASDDNGNVAFYNETNDKGVLFTWEELQFLAILLGLVG